MERNLKRKLRDVSFATAIALVMTLAGLVSLSPSVSATTDVLRLLTSKEWKQDAHTGVFSVVAADLDSDGTVEIIVGGVSITIAHVNRGYLAVFHYGGCMKTLELLDYEVWNSLPPYQDTAVLSVAVGDIDTTVSHPGLEIVTAGSTRNTLGYFRGEMRLWEWEGVTRTLQPLGDPKIWPDGLYEPDTLAYSVFAANLDADLDVEVVTAGSYGDQPELAVWRWSGSGFDEVRRVPFPFYTPGSWKGVSVGNIDEDGLNGDEIASVGYGAIGGASVGLVQLWHLTGTRPSQDLETYGPPYVWGQDPPSSAAAANSTFAGIPDPTRPGDLNFATVGYATVSGVDEQEMNIFDWDPATSSITRIVHEWWKPDTASGARGYGMYAADVDMDMQVEELAVGVSGMSGSNEADLSIWHWDGETYPIELETWETWSDPYFPVLAHAVFAGNANGDLDGIPEIITVGTVTESLPPVRMGQLRVWDWNLPPVTNEWTETNDWDPQVGWRNEHAMAYYSSVRKTILFGGENSVLYDTTVEYDHDTGDWDFVIPIDHPSARREHAMVYDTWNDRIVLFGGMGARDAYLTDTWEFSYGPPATWTNLYPSGQTPTQRYAPAMAYDELHGEAILFGGREPSGTYPTDTYNYSYSLNRWFIRGALNPPPGRAEHVMAYDCKRDKMVLFGGYNGANLNDLWEYDYDDNKWTPVNVPSPLPRQAPVMSYDVQGEVLVLFGGAAGATYFYDTWTYDGSSWTDRTGSTHPPGRYESAMVYDIYANRHVMFGGYDGDPSWPVKWDTWEYRYS